MVQLIPLSLAEDPGQHFEHAGGLALSQDSLPVNAGCCDHAEVFAERRARVGLPSP